MKNKKQRGSWNKKGPLVKPTAPSVRSNTNAFGHMPERTFFAVNCRKGSGEYVLKGNLKSRFRNSFWNCSISVMYMVRAHLKAAVFALILTGFNFLLEYFSVDPLVTWGFKIITGIGFIWIFVEFIQDETGIMCRDWLVTKFNNRFA